MKYRVLMLALTLALYAEPISPLPLFDTLNQ